MTAIHHSPMGAIRAVAMAPDQVNVATVGLDRSISIWDVRLPKAEAPALTIGGAHDSEATAVAWHPAGAVIASGGVDATVRLWDWRRAGGGGGPGSTNGATQPLGSYAGHTGAVARLAFTADGNQLASIGSDASLILWRVV